jgi:hypothetical protein
MGRTAEEAGEVSEDMRLTRVVCEDTGLVSVVGAGRAHSSLTTPVPWGLAAATLLENR